MKDQTFALLSISCCILLVGTASSFPTVVDYTPGEYEQVRERRSPQQSPGRGSFGLSGSYTPGSFGQPSQTQFSGDFNRRVFHNRGQVSVSGSYAPGPPSQGSLRAGYDHTVWQGRKGQTLDVGGHYQRNWGGEGPKNDYGVGVKLNFGKRR